MSRKKTKIPRPSPDFDRISLSCKKLTPKQKKFLDLALNPNMKIMFVAGPAGSSKTYMAVYSALRRLVVDHDLDLLYVRTIKSLCIKIYGKESCCCQCSL